VTAVLPRASTPAADSDEETVVRPRVGGRERVAFGVLMAVTAALYLWNLSASGWANAFYFRRGAGRWTGLDGNAVRIQ